MGLERLIVSFQGYPPNGVGHTRVCMHQDARKIHHIADAKPASYRIQATACLEKPDPMYIAIHGPLVVFQNFEPQQYLGERTSGVLVSRASIWGTAFWPCASSTSGGEHWPCSP